MNAVIKMKNRTEFMIEHNQRIMAQLKRSMLSKILDKITNTKRDIYGYRIYPNDITYKLARDYLKTVKDEVELGALAVHLDIHWLRLKQVLYTQELVRTPVGIKMCRKSLISGWIPVLRDSKIYFKRNETRS